MAKQWVRQHQVQRDEVQDLLDQGVEWVLRNRQTSATAAGIAAAVILVASLAAYRTRTVRNESWERLGVAESLAYSGRAESALDQLKQLVAEQPSSDAAGYAAVFAGDLQFQHAQYKDAADNYLKVLERSTPKILQPVALTDLAIAQEAEGQPKEAAQTAQRFLETYPDHFLAPQAHACLARALAASGQAEQARAALQKIVLQYPDTTWAAWAQSRLKGS